MVPPCACYVISKVCHVHKLKTYPYHVAFVNIAYGDGVIHSYDINVLLLFHTDVQLPTKSSV